MLYLIEILHQTTTVKTAGCFQYRCILSKFYIKPQPCYFVIHSFIVVSYRNSTSNHNHIDTVRVDYIVVSYRNSTSNHNWKSFIVCSLVLYLIEILHQTTTITKRYKYRKVLYLIEILHQTTTRCQADQSCGWLYLIEILHQTTTSRRFSDLVDRLYLIEILHQTTTVSSAPYAYSGCILSKFYIKPQHRFNWCFFLCVVSYRNSTSNHNQTAAIDTRIGLYLIEILHQTTTIFRTL